MADIQPDVFTPSAYIGAYDIPWSYPERRRLTIGSDWRP